ncbi:MAG TPA: co-chaperone GroES [Nitrospirota bacterium]|nr:co-chaperone GroES [Nitrospirota bacterium]
MSLKPLHDWAVIVPAEAQTQTAGGLYIPDTAKEKPEEGVVEAIGPGAYEEEKQRKKPGEKKKRRFIPTVVKPGDRVLYERHAGQAYKVAGEDRILVRERDILGFLLESNPLIESRSRPLQIPASTSPSSATKAMTVTSGASSAPRQGRKAAKTGKKAAKKPAPKKKVAKKAVKKKTAKKKTATAKPAKKGGKTAAKKSGRKR